MKKLINTFSDIIEQKVSEFFLNFMFFFILGIALDTHYEMERGQKVAGTLSPLIPSRSIDNAAIL